MTGGDAMRGTQPGDISQQDTVPMWLSYKDTAALMAASERTVRRIVEEDGGLTAYRLRGRTIRFKRTEVLAYMDSTAEARPAVTPTPAYQPPIPRRRRKRT